MEADTLLKVLSAIGTMISVGSTLDSLFGGSAPLTADEVQTIVRQEVEAAFFRQSAEQVIIDAASALQTAQAFLAVDYLNATKSASKAELWEKLDASGSAPHLSDLETQAGILEGWMTDSDQQPNGNRIAGKAALVYLGLYLTICLFHSERSKVAPDQRDAELKDMTTKAAAALGVIQPRIQKLVSDRLGCLSYHDYYGFGIGGASTSAIVDSWFDAGSAAVQCYYQDRQQVLRDTWACYHAVLSIGSDTDCAGFRTLLDNDALNPVGGMAKAQVPNFLKYEPVYDQVCGFGSWASQARNLMVQLQLVAQGIKAGQAGWAYCSHCSGMYYGVGGPSVCPAPNSFGHGHDAGASFNYVLRCDSPAPAPNLQSDWRWCSKCGALHFGSGTGVCPAGGAHAVDGSGDYVLGTTADINTSAIGVADAQSQWNWCRKCAGLHFAPGTSVCPAGSSHDSTGSGNYWINHSGIATY